MNKNESKYFNTAILFDEALIYLLENKDIEYITIKEICNKEGVNRSTFYLHYENINDLLEETMNYINKKFMNYFNENTKEFIEKIKNIEGRDEIMTNASRIINREIRKQRKAGLEQGLEQGIEQGFKQGIIQIAKKLKREMSIKDISRITGLTEQEIENL